MGIPLDQLDPTASPQRDHVVPAIRESLTVRLSVAQILGLLQQGDIPDGAVALAKLAADARDSANHTFDPTASGLDAKTVQAAIDEIRGLIGDGWGLIKRTVITASRTHNFDPTATRALVEVQGGGAGGQSALSPAARASAAGAGGGAGGFASKFFALSGISSATIVVGSGGAAGASGGTSSYDDGTNTVTATGGGSVSAATGATGARSEPGGAGGTGSGGDLNVSGQPGNGAFSTGMDAVASQTVALSGEGASSRFGGGGRTVTLNISTASSAAGTAATGFGAGGGGAAAVAAGAGANGGAGSPGVVVIWEFR